ncbi:MAG TPA: MBL fold metallo-hydrolase [Stellaceae bacterium]|nr:MBL fold metallo-hydrolase [Stellaceae bacterium]
MRVTYISHACLLVETEDACLVCDPWLAGPAYADQWNVFPKPVDTAAVERAQFILISHGHEDHLHDKTLRSIRKDKTLYYPYYWYDGTFSYLSSLGFRRTVEAKSRKTYRLSPKTRVTFIVNGQDSVIVLEDSREVLVNCNDALHASDSRLIELYTRIIKDRWPKIDMAFCSFASASYFPNAFRCSGKDDAAIGRLREQLYVQNFCNIIERLAPTIAVPFAADFVLLAKRQLWINAVRFRREEISSYYARYFGQHSDSPRIAVMYPGDRIVDKTLLPSSQYRLATAEGSREGLLAAQYPEPISAFSRNTVHQMCLRQIGAILEDHLANEVRHYPQRTVAHLRFSVRLLDLADQGWLNVSIANRIARVSVGDQAGSEAMALIETTSDILLNSLSTDWGGDALIIGYACEISILGPQFAGQARICAELLTRYPRPVSYAMRHPTRAIRYLLQSLPAVKVRGVHRLRGLAGKGIVATQPSMSSNAWLVGDEHAIREGYALPNYPVT